MTMLLLCFVGILVMFLFFIRTLSSRAAETREFFRKQQLTLADIERQLMDMSFTLRKIQGGEGDAGPAGAASGDSAGKTAQSGGAASMRQEDLVALLENVGQREDLPLRFDDQLLPPPPAARPVTEEYDPAKDPDLFEDSLLPESAYGTYRSRADRSRSGSPTKRGPSLSIKLDD